MRLSFKVARHEHGQLMCVCSYLHLHTILPLSLILHSGYPITPEYISCMSQRLNVFLKYTPAFTAIINNFLFRTSSLDTQVF